METKSETTQPVNTAERGGCSTAPICSGAERDVFTKRVTYWLWVDGEKVDKTGCIVADDLLQLLVSRGWMPPNDQAE